MLLILWYMLVSIFLLINANPIQIRPGKMDDFIAELMASEKFEELTDIIVNKAVSKMKNMNQEKLIKTKANVTVLRHHYDYDAEREKNKRKSVKLKKDHYDENKSIYKKENKPIHTGKIDARTLLKDIPTEELLLSFKHLIETQKGPEKKKSNQRGDNDIKRYYASDLVDDISDRKNKETKKGRVSNNIGKMISEHDYGDSSYGSDSHNVEEKREKDRKSSESFEKHIGKHKKAPHLAEKTTEVTKKSLMNLKSYERNNKTIDLHKIIERNKSSKEIVEVKLDHRNSEKENKQSLKEEPTTKLNKKKYRKEDGKLYTYNSSSDYDEYHEKLIENERKRKHPL